MNFTKRLQLTAVSAAALLSTLAFAAPASAATTYFRSTSTCPLSSNYNSLYSQWLLSRYSYSPVRVSVPTAPAAQPAPATPSPASAPVATPTQTAPQTSTTAGLTAAEQQMLNLVNAERAKTGLRPLQADLTLTKLARMKSQDMIAKNYFSHQSPTYGSPFDLLATYKVAYRTAGENLAGNSSVPGAHTALMNSSGHRANILNSGYTKVGIGIVSGGQYGMMFTQLFTG